MRAGVKKNKMEAKITIPVIGQLDINEDTLCHEDLAIYQCDAAYNGINLGRIFLRLPPLPSNLSIPHLFKDLFYLTKVEVKPEARKKGVGSLLLEKALDYAGGNNTPVFTRPLPFGDGPLPPYEKLVEFYSQHGFCRYDSQFLIWIPEGRRK
jgi:GNAT superfamily N-acetyltransferase